MAYEYYDTLGIPRDADEDAIKKAYRKKAMEHHPDRHGGDKDKEKAFKEINEAYATLSDSGKRARYDRTGTSQDAGGSGGFDASGFDFSDIFESFFSGGFGGAGSTRRARGGDRETIAEVSFAESVSGVRKTVTYSRTVKCHHCHGSGAETPEDTKTCTDCQGRGRVRRRMQTVFGVMEQETVCPTCEGRGKTVSKKCHVCRGRGLEDIRVEKPIDIPAGIDDGMSMKVAGEGDEVADGQTGDLYIHIEVGEPPAGMTREDVNLRYTLELHPVELVLGVEKPVKIPVVGERVIDLAAGTQVGSVVRFTGDGVPSLQRERRGDLFVEIAVRIPEKLSKKERELYVSLAKEAKIEPRSGGILSKLFE